MATTYRIRAVYNFSSGRVYKRGIDWTDDGSGVLIIEAGSDLETDYADGAGDPIRVERESITT